MIRDIQLFIKGTEQACGFAPKGTQNLQPSETGSVDVFFFLCVLHFICCHKTFPTHFVLHVRPIHCNDLASVASFCDM